MNVKVTVHYIRRKVRNGELVGIKPQPHFKEGTVPLSIHINRNCRSAAQRWGIHWITITKQDSDIYKQDSQQQKNLKEVTARIREVAGCKQPALRQRPSSRGTTVHDEDTPQRQLSLYHKNNMVRERIQRSVL